MYKLSFVLLLLTALSLRTQAQQAYTESKLTYGIHPGTVTNLDGTIISGYIFHGYRKENQDNCVFYADYKDGRSKKVYRPSEIAGYSIENDQYKSVAYSGNIGFGKPDKHFLYVTQPGAITTYIYFAPAQQPVWQKGNDEPVSNASLLLSFKKSILKLVGDDAELAAKIERKDKGYGMLNTAQIIDEYNAWAAAKAK